MEKSLVFREQANLDIFPEKKNLGRIRRHSVIRPSLVMDVTNLKLLSSERMSSEREDSQSLDEQRRFLGVLDHFAGTQVRHLNPCLSF